MKLPKANLLVRMSLALAAVGLIPLGVIPYLVRLNREAITDQVLRTHAVAARSSAARIESFVGGLRQSANAVALNPELSSRPRSSSAQELVAGLLQAQPLIVGAVVYNSEGGEVFRVQSRARADIVEAVLAAPTRRPLVPRREFGTLWLRLSIPLLHEVGELRLVAEGTPLESLMQSEELGRDAVIAAVSQEDGVIVSSEPEVTLQSFPGSMLETALSGRVSGASRFAGGPGIGSLGAYAPVAELGWSVLSRQPIEVAEEVASQMQRQALLAVGVALLLTALLSAGAYASVIRPVRRLVAAQKRLAHAPRGLGTGNEIQQLRAGVAALERQTLDREALDKTFLGRYLVMEVLGSGGMGTVFRGWDPKLQRQVALKTVHLEQARASETHHSRQSSLIGEAVTLARVSHPNIVSVFDVEDSGQVAFIAMEYVDGTDLHSLLEERGTLPSTLVVPLGAAIARALAAAHAHQVVHRDVKPNNVLLGTDDSIKVTDFGIAGHVTAVPGGDSLIGTPGYIPPEAVRGQPHDALGDLFSLGVVMYECLTGRNPFEAHTAQETLVRTQSAQPLPLRVRDGSISEELERFVLGLLAKTPEQRQPATASEAAEHLHGLVAAGGKRWSYPDPPSQPADVAPPGAGTRRVDPPWEAGDG